MQEIQYNKALKNMVNLNSIEVKIEELQATRICKKKCNISSY